MSKDFITVAAHRRAFPKRKFADGGASSDRPDLDILAKQGLSPERPPGIPPRIIQEHLLGDWSGADTGGGGVQRVERAGEDLPGRPGGSVLSQMMDKSADRVQSAQNDARATAAMRAFRDKLLAQPAKRFADGGANYRTPEQIHADRMRQYGFDPMGSYSLGTDAAETAAPLPMPAGVPSTMPAPPVAPLSSSQGSASRQMSADTPASVVPSTPTPLPESESGVPPPARSASGSGTQNSPGAPKPITFKDIAAGATKGAQAGGGSPIGTLASLAGGALGTYVKKRAANNAAAANQGIDASAARRGDVGDANSTSSGDDTGPSTLRRNPGDSDLSGVDLSGLAPSMGPDMEGDWGVDESYARGGEVSPQQGTMQRRAWPMRPGAPTSTMGPLGAAPGGASAGSPPQSSWTPAQMQPVGNPNSPWAAANFPGNPNNPPGVQAGPPGPGAAPPPGGPPPQSTMGPMQGPPPGGPLPGGMNPQLQAALAQRAQMGGMGGPPPGGPGPQFGAMGGPPAGAGGPPPGMGGMAAGMAGPPPGMPPGGPPPGPPPGGPPSGPPSQMAGLPPGGPSNAQLAAASSAPPSMGAQLGALQGGGDPRAAQMAMMQRAQMGGVPGMKKGGRVFGGEDKPAEDLPPEPEKKAKGGVLRRRPGGKKKVAKKAPPMPPMVTDEDMDTPPPPMAAAGPAGPPPGPPPAAPPPAGPPPGMKEGGECKGMAAGGVAKVRHGFPNVNKKPKKMAKGGSVRGCGVATKGKKFSGIY